MVFKKISVQCSAFIVNMIKQDASRFLSKALRKSFLPFIVMKVPLTDKLSDQNASQKGSRSQIRFLGTWVLISVYTTGRAGTLGNSAASQQDSVTSKLSPPLGK